MAPSTHPDYTIVKFTVKINDDEPIDVLVEGQDTVHMVVPENSKYVTSLHFRANVDLKDFKYTQYLKKAGIVVKTKNIDVGTYKASDEIYVKELPEDTTPGGFLFRGHYPATSVYYADGKELNSVDWNLEIVKK